MLTFRRESLLTRNTFGLDAIAERFADVHSEAALRGWCAARSSDEARQPPFVLGGGSNILLTRDRIETPVLHIAPRGIRVLEDAGESVLVEAMAGEPWHAFVIWTIEQGFNGLENLSLIPGYVGAAPVQNVGAYGVETKDTCESVVVVDTFDGSTQTLSRDQCKFGYRDSVFKHVDAQTPRDRFVITRVRFRLSRAFTPRIEYGDIQKELASQSVDVKTLSARDVSNAVIAIRSRKLPDPKVIGNAGSFFKNPVVPKNKADELVSSYSDLKPFYTGQEAKIPAAWLIDKAGWKAHKKGAVGVHANHALVLVNHGGGGSGAALWKLACDIRDDVQQKFGITLEPEPRIV